MHFVCIVTIILLIYHLYICIHVQIIFSLKKKNVFGLIISLYNHPYNKFVQNDCIFHFCRSAIYIYYYYYAATIISLYTEFLYVKTVCSSIDHNTRH